MSDVDAVPLNPFATPFTQPEWVAGREDELRTLLDAVRHDGLAVVVRGVRGIGKTALIERFRHVCGDGIRSIYLDVRDYIAAHEVRNEAAARHRLAGAIAEELSFSGLLPARMRPDEVSEGILFREVLPEICGPNQPRLVIVLDELDYLDPAVIRSVWRSFFRSRNLRRPPLFVAALGEVWSGNAAEALPLTDQRLQSIRLEALDRDEVKQLLARYAEQGILTFTPDAGEAVWAETRGFPLFLVALLDAIHHRSFAENERGQAVTAVAVHEGADLCTLRMPERVHHALTQAGPAAQRTLISLVEHQALSMQELLQLVQTDWKASREEVVASVEGLARAGLVTDPSGVLEVSIPLLKGWITRLTAEEVELAEHPPAADAFAAFREAEVLEYEGKRDEAIERLTTALSLAPRYWRARWLLARLLVARADTRPSDFIDAEQHLRELVEEVPWRGGMLADVERQLCRVLVSIASTRTPGEDDYRRLCRDILNLDPGLTQPGARERIAAQELEDWARLLDRSPQERWLEATRRVLRHDRCWQGVADRLSLWLTELVEESGEPRRITGLLQGVARPLLEVEPPDGAHPGFWPPLIRLIERMSVGPRTEATHLSSATWEALLLSQSSPRRREILQASSPLIRHDLAGAVSSGDGGEAARLVQLLAGVDADDVLRLSLEDFTEAVLGLEDHRERRHALIESAGPYLAALMSIGPRLHADVVDDACDLAVLLLETEQQTGDPSAVISQDSSAAWNKFVEASPHANSLESLVKRLRAARPRSYEPLGLATGEADELEELLDNVFKVDRRISMRVPGLWNPIAEESVRAYRAHARFSEDHEYLIRVFSLRGDNLDMLRILRTIWDKERRTLAALSVTPAGQSLTRFIDARYDAASDRAILVTEWPGEMTLRERLTKERGGLFAPEARARLWGHLAALLESIQALHANSFIHRAIRPEIIYIKGDEDRESRVSPLFKLGHFEWSVYLRGLSSMASTLSRDLNRYIAPEALRATLEIDRGPAGESFSSDLYATGLLLFECLVRSFTDSELGFYRNVAAYDVDEEQTHRKWIEQLREEVRQEAANPIGEHSTLDPRERDILLSLLHFDLERRPTHLEDIVRKAEALATTEVEVGSPLYAVTTLSARPGFDDPRLDRRCIASFLKPQLSEVEAVLNPAQELSPMKLARLIEDELRGASVHLNGRSGTYPLLLMSRSGLLFRVQRFVWDQNRSAEVDANLAYLEVARSDDRLVPTPIAHLSNGIRLIDIKEDEVNRLRRELRVTVQSSWDALFQVAERARPSIEDRAKAAIERRGMADVLALTIRLEHEALTQEIGYQIVDNEKRTIRAQKDGVNLAERLAHACADDPHFELARFRTAAGLGTQILLDDSAFDFESGTITLPLTAADIPPQGVIRPSGSSGADIQYARRRRILRQLEDDEFLLDNLVLPSRNARPRASGESERRGHDRTELPERGDAIIPDLDEDKLGIARRFFQVEPLLIVQGPPATGKTTLASEIVLRLLERVPHGRILITTHGHEPLDNLLERIVNEARLNQRASRILQEVQIVRIPSGWKKREHGIAARYYPHARAEELFQRLKDWCRQQQPSLGLASVVAKVVSAELAGYVSAPNSLRRRIQDGANLVFATVNSSHIERERQSSYDLVVVEEAARCYPIEVAGAMRLARRWLLIGDHQQLPPFGFMEIEKAFDEFSAGETQASKDDPEAERHEQQRWLSGVRSRFYPYLHLFRHLHEDPGEHRATLRTQWRMHPVLGEMVSEVFYKGKAVKNPEPEAVLKALAARRVHHFTDPQWLRGKQLIWIDIPHASKAPECGEVRRAGGLIDNPAERRTLVGLLRKFRSSRVSKDVAILTPYRAQAEHLIGLLRENINHFDAFGAIDDRVFTIDAFQGRQAGCVVLSLVRNNHGTTPRDALGFLMQRERATVMFSRAERLLVVIGSIEHFEGYESQGVEWIGEVVDRAEIVKWNDVLPSHEIAKLLERYEHR